LASAADGRAAVDASASVISFGRFSSSSAVAAATSSAAACALVSAW
jgi:hypothetical protein